MSKQLRIDCDNCGAATVFDSELCAEAEGWLIDEDIDIDNGGMSMIGELCPSCAKEA